MSLTFKILQLATPNIDSYAAYSIASVRGYAKKHGHQHLVQRSRLVDDMHINWTKIVLLQNALAEKDVDYVVLLDADIILTTTAPPLEDFVKMGNEATHILMPGDTPLLGSKRPNAGMIIVKNSPEGRGIIDYWLHAARHEGKHLADTHPRNQLVYWNFVMPRFKPLQFIIPRSYARKYYPIYHYLGKRGGFLWHVTQTNEGVREKYMKRLFEQYRSGMGDFQTTSEALKGATEGLVKLVE
jgi:hypothetical protein